MNCPSGRERVRKRSISTNARPSVVEVVGCTGIELPGELTFTLLARLSVPVGPF